MTANPDSSLPRPFFMKISLLGSSLLLLAASRLSAQGVAVDPALPAYHPAAPVSGTLAAVSADTMEGMIKSWGEAFKRQHPEANIAETMRELNPEDRAALGPNTDQVFNNSNEPYEDAYGYEPFRVQVSMAAFNLREHIQAIGVYVNKDNPISQLSLAQLDAMYSCTRRRGYPADITTWGQLGLTGAWADKPVHIYGRAIKKDEVGMYFRDIVLLDGLYKDSFQSPGKGVSVDVVKAVTEDPYGIGYCAFAYKTEALKSLALFDDRGVLGQPTLGDVASGRYPLDRPLYFYVNRKPGQPLDPLVKEFLSFVLSREGQEIVARATYLPLPSVVAAAERAKLE